MLKALGTTDDIVNSSHSGPFDDKTNLSNSKNSRQQKCIGINSSEILKTQKQFYRPSYAIYIKGARIGLAF